MKKRSIPSKPTEPTPSPVDPNAHPDPDKWLGKRCTFLHGGRVLGGKCIGSKFAGFTARGRIPNYELIVMGQSGRSLTVDMVEQYTIFE